MADVKWIKITTDIFDDEKILLIESMPSSDSIITIWFKLLILAGKQNNNGVFMMSNKLPYTDEMLATIFRRDINTVRLALSTFEKFGMIEIVDNVITIPNWNKHQTLDAYERKKERDRAYQKDRRERQKMLIDGKSSDKSSDVAVSEEEREEDKDIDKKENTKRKNFIPPTVDEVKEYIDSVGSQIDAESFVAFYESKGWMVGKNKMKSWKAAIVTWEKRNGLKRSPPKKSDPVQQEDEELVGDDWWK